MQIIHWMFWMNEFKQTDPMPLLGGNLHNNVVSAVYFACASHLKCTTLRFNFRGVGSSTGTHYWGSLLSSLLSEY